MKYITSTKYYWFLPVAVLIVLLNSVWSQRAAAGEYSDDSTMLFLPVLLSPSIPAPEWLEYVNHYRAMAELPPVRENPDWSYGNELHGRYSVKNDVLIHDEDPANPWFTPEGQAAARASNLAGSYDYHATYVYAIDSWMQAPFHAVGILDPQLQRVGYGDYREDDGRLAMGAGLDVIRGQGGISPSITFPIIWPADGTTVALRLHWGEYPSPLTSCQGYSTPAGLPFIIQIGPGDRVPNVTAHALTRNGVPLEHCVFDETNYFNPVSDEQRLVRGILGSRDAIVLIPRDPLSPGVSYDVSVTTNGETYSWSFEVSEDAQMVEYVAEGVVIPYMSLDP